MDDDVARLDVRREKNLKIHVLFLLLAADTWIIVIWSYCSIWFYRSFPHEETISSHWILAKTEISRTAIPVSYFLSLITDTSAVVMWWLTYGKIICWEKQ